MGGRGGYVPRGVLQVSEFDFMDVPPYAAIRDIWNEIAVPRGFPRIGNLGNALRPTVKLINQAWPDYPSLDQWRLCIDAYSRSEWHAERRIKMDTMLRRKNIDAWMEEGENLQRKLEENSRVEWHGDKRMLVNRDTGEVIRAID